jgi:hypothetical protein
MTDDVEELASYLLKRADEVSTNSRIHYLRLHRALTSRPVLEHSHPEAVEHVFSRLGIWAGYLAEDLENDLIPRSETAEMLRSLSRFGDLALKLTLQRF